MYYFKLFFHDEIVWKKYFSVEVKVEQLLFETKLRFTHLGSFLKSYANLNMNLIQNIFLFKILH